MFTVTCLDDGREYLFSAKTPYEAMQKMMYCLNLKHKEEIVMNKTESGRCLWMGHNGRTYAVRLK